MSVKLRMQRVWRRSAQKNPGHWRRVDLGAKQPSFQHWSSVCKVHPTYDFLSSCFDQFDIYYLMAVYNAFVNFNLVLVSKVM